MSQDNVSFKLSFRRTRIFGNRAIEQWQEIKSKDMNLVYIHKLLQELSHLK